MYKPGDRVRVIARDEDHFNDYIEGDVAIVERSDTNAIWVTWETNILNAIEDDRIRYLFPEEVELVP